jgi:TolB-like protein/lipopolysaccharide biosynthesis regulator YciM
MFTDLVGYSALVQDNEAQAMILLEQHNNILRALFEQHDGREIKSTGDGFLVEFKSSLQAVRCAIGMQSSLHGHNMGRKPEQQIQIRIGVHLGDVQEREDDIFGDGVNIAARIEPLASAGGICISNAVYEQIHNKVDVGLDSIGPQSLKNIAEPVKIFRVVLPWQDKIEEKIKPQTTLLRKVPLAVVSVSVVVAVILTWWAATNSTLTDIVPLQPGEITSIAVIPFENLSSDPENQYFTEGLAEEMRNALVKIDGLRVPSYTSSSSDTMQDLSLNEIAALLGVEAVLEGSVRKSGDQLRITAQLIRASDDTHLWSEQFDRQMGDIFEIQEEIARAIVDKLSIETSGNEQIVTTGTENIEAYNLYLQGRFQWNKRNEEGFSRAIDYFEQAVALDPNYAQAYVGLADSFSQSGGYGHLQRDEGYAKAEEYANMALEINENTAEAYATLGHIDHYFYRDFETAESHFLMSIELNPNYPTAHHWYRRLLSDLGRNDEALSHIERARELDPLSPVILQNVAQEHQWRQQYNEAIEAIEMIFEINPDFPNAYRTLSGIYQEQGNWHMAEETLLRGIERIPDSHTLHSRYAETLLLQRKFELADEQFQKAIHLGPNAIVPRVVRGINYLWQRRFPEAIKQLNDTLLLDKTHLLTHEWLARAYFENKEYEKAFEIVDQATQYFDSSDNENRARFERLRGMIHARLGDSEQAEQSLEILKQEDLSTLRSLPDNLAYIYAALEDRENTIHWLQEASRTNKGSFVYLITDLIYDPYRDDPRFQELLKLNGLAD